MPTTRVHDGNMPKVKVHVLTHARNHTHEYADSHNLHSLFMFAMSGTHVSATSVSDPSVNQAQC